MRARLIGALLFACGLVLCYGAMDLWSAGVEAHSFEMRGLARLAGAVVVAVFGVGNVFAGLILVLRRTVRT